MHGADLSMKAAHGSMGSGGCEKAPAVCHSMHAMLRTVSGNSRGSWRRC